MQVPALSAVVPKSTRPSSVPTLTLLSMCPLAGVANLLGVTSLMAANNLYLFV